MEIFDEISPLKAFLRHSNMIGKSIGLVPTMGALHEGHLSLIEASKSQNQATICSIFINPAQFNSETDLKKYPRTFDKDIEKLKKVECDAVFYPHVQEMYPEPSAVSFDFGPMGMVMEGKYRPGHFSGVGLVLCKFFNLVKPHQVYFGQKDWQQFALVKRMVSELKFDLTMNWVPTTREKDGLALSSRNMRLNPDQRKRAPVFFKALQVARESLISGMSMEEVRLQVQDIMDKETGVRLEYIELADSENLNVLNSVEESEKPILCIAGYVGEVRLIDNMFIDL